MFQTNEHAESKEAEVRILSLTMMFRDRPELVLPIPFTNKPKSSLFTLKGGSKYRTKFTFAVSKNIVSGLMYTTSVWKTGVKGKIFKLAFTPY